jgi:hypothetical protein
VEPIIGEGQNQFRAVAVPDRDPARSVVGLIRYVISGISGTPTFTGESVLQGQGAKRLVRRDAREIELALDRPLFELVPVSLALVQSLASRQEIRLVGKATRKRLATLHRSPTPIQANCRIELAIFFQLARQSRVDAIQKFALLRRQLLIAHHGFGSKRHGHVGRHTGVGSKLARASKTRAQVILQYRKLCAAAYY